MKFKFIILLFLLIVMGLSFSIEGPIIEPSVKIPKIIHYVWLGSPNPPESFEKILQSWKKFAPDYQIKRWDEKNCNLDANPFVRNAIANKAWAWASDYCRFTALAKEGGVYFDVDHELTAPLDDLLAGANRSFTFQAINNLSASFIAAQPNDPIILYALKEYENQKDFSYIISPSILSNAFKREFKDIPLDNTFYNKNGTVLWPTNIAMINFNGGENKAIHYYAATNIVVTSGVYYEIFKDEFLNNRTIKICETLPKSLIFSEPNRVYTYKINSFADVLLYTDKKLILKWDLPQKIQTYQIKNGCYYPIYTPTHIELLKHLPTKIARHILNFIEKD